jgi:hypothetical protein
MGITTLTAGMYKWAGRATLGAGIVIGGMQVYNGYQQEGGQFGYHAQKATAGFGGGLAGSFAGAELGELPVMQLVFGSAELEQYQEEL